ncbi:ATPase [filamentous cyanobacterium CCT1]|nr:ATPase [filamentous cyanobacterium CCT1]PSN81337.1 ATPase [filamentous cyanobacterium CCP4]
MNNQSNFFAHPVGVFQGFSNSGLEFHADIMLPYQPNFQVRPMHGSFLLVELENEDEAVLGRISSLQSMGRLSGSGGAEYAIRTLQRSSIIPENIREDHLRYKVDIRVLGVLRYVSGEVVFAPSHRRLPHVGSRVAFPQEEVLREVSNDRDEFGSPIGHLAMGEYIYALGDAKHEVQPDVWHQVIEPSITPRFDISSMVSRKTFIFARAGYGKSNLNKLLFSKLYSLPEPPSISWKDSESIPVGTLIFDPEGEYFWPDNNNRPGFADVPELLDRLMIFTDRKHPSSFYEAFKVGPAKMDLSRMPAQEVLTMALPEDRDAPAWATRIANLSIENWAEAITLVHQDRFSTNLDELAEAMGLTPKKKKGETEGWELNEVQLNAVRRELANIVSKLHEPGAVTFEAILEGLKKGMIVVFDLSQLPPSMAENITRTIMRRIFKYNQNAFTEVGKNPIPTIAVLEEAQTVLGGTKLSDTDPIVSWVKEGRKYNLGAVLVTQQPGAISDQILSQGDNWFVFHLVSGSDLSTLKRANGHFSDDLLQSLLNEPIKGQGMFWSSESKRSYPIPIRVLPFDNIAPELKSNEKRIEATLPNQIRKSLVKDIYGDNIGGNVVSQVLEAGLKNLSNKTSFMQKVRDGALHDSYFAMQLKESLPNGNQIFPDDKQCFIACRRKVKDFMIANFGLENEGWKSEKRNYKGKMANFYKVIE